MSCDRPFIFLTVLTSFWESDWAMLIFMGGDLFNRPVAAIHSFRVYMEHIMFDSSYWLRSATFLEGLSYAFDFLGAAYLCNHSNCSHPSLEVAYLFLCFMKATHWLNCTLSFLFVVPHAVICCQSLWFVVTLCHLFSHAVIRFIRCHSLPLVGTQCTTHLSFYKRS